MHNPAFDPEKAVLVGLVTAKQDEDKVHDYLDKLKFLLETAGAIADKHFVQKLRKP
jgi:GTPase